MEDILSSREDNMKSQHVRQNPELAPDIDFLRIIYSLEVI